MQRKHRDKGQQDDQHGKENRPDDHASGSAHDLHDVLGIGKPRHPPLLHCMCFADHRLGDDHGCVDQHTDGNGQSAQRHNVGSDAGQLHQDKGEQDGERQWQRDDENAPQMSQEKDMGQRHEDDLLDQGETQGADSTVDQFAPVVEGLDRDTGRKGFGDFGDLLLHPRDHFPGALSVAHDHDSPHRLAAGNIKHSPPRLRTHGHRRDLLQQNRAPLKIADRDGLQILQRTDKRNSPDRDITPVDFDIPATDIPTRSLDLLDDPG